MSLLNTKVVSNVNIRNVKSVKSRIFKRIGITNQQPQDKRAFTDYIKLFSKEMADEIASMSKKESDMW